VDARYVHRPVLYPFLWRRGFTIPVPVAPFPWFMRGEGFLRLYFYQKRDYPGSENYSPHFDAHNATLKSHTALAFFFYTSQFRTHPHTHAPTPMHTHPRTHARTHTRTHAHTHTQHTILPTHSRAFRWWSQRRKGCPWPASFGPQQRSDQHPDPRPWACPAENKGREETKERLILQKTKGERKQRKGLSCRKQRERRKQLSRERCRVWQRCSAYEMRFGLARTVFIHHTWPYPGDYPAKNAVCTPYI